MPHDQFYSIASTIGKIVKKLSATTQHAAFCLRILKYIKRSVCETFCAIFRYDKTAESKAHKLTVEDKQKHVLTETFMNNTISSKN